MASVKRIITPALLKSVARLKSQQVIFGSPLHPRRLKQQIEPPDYSHQFGRRDIHAKMCYCCRGNCVVVINGTAYLMQTGDMAFIQRNADIFVSFVQKKRPYSLYWMVMQGWNRMGLHQSVYNARGAFSIAYNQWGNIPAKLCRLLDQIIMQGLAGDNKWSWLKTEIVRLVTGLSQQPTSAIVPFDNKWQEKRIMEIDAYLKENILQDLSLTQVAQRFSLSPNYLDTLFQQIRGESVIQYLNSLRLNAAARALLQTTQNVNEIARASGYKDELYFRRIFKKYISLTPSEYRKFSV